MNRKCFTKIIYFSFVLVLLINSFILAQLNKNIVEKKDNKISESVFLSRSKNFESKTIENGINFSLSKTSEVPTLKIMPLGNSITLGETRPSPGYINLNGYRKALNEKLVNNGVDIDFVGQESSGTFTDNQHEGHGGWHTKHWENNHELDLDFHLLSFLEENPPEIILLHIGTNDISDYSLPGNDNTIDTTVSNVSGLLDKIFTFDPTIKVILAKITNQVSTPSIITEYNNALEVMANNRIANGDSLSLVDMESALDYDVDLSDGLHPNESGYSKMADVWFDGISSLITIVKDERISRSLSVLYNFEDKNKTIKDISDLETSIDLVIDDTTKVRWVSYGLEIISPTIISANSSSLKIYNNGVHSNEITLEAWLKAKSVSQTGPVRIITFSKDDASSNFTLGQQNSKYVVRLSTTNTNDNGLPEITSDDGSVTTELTHVVYTRNRNGNTNVYINGVLKASGTLGGDFSVWNDTYSFGLANDFETERNWLGTYYLMAVYSRALSANEVQHNFEIGFNGDKKILFIPTNLNASVSNDTIVNLNWKDNSENELGYIIERKATSADSIYYKLNTLGENITHYTDISTKHSTSYFYRVKAYNSDNTSAYSDSIKVDNLISSIENEISISNFQLHQNYPNPFNPSTTIKYSIPKASKVSLVIFDILGKVVATLIDNSKKEEGLHSTQFETATINRNLTSGIYFYKIIANPVDGSEIFVETKKLLLVK